MFYARKHSIGRWCNAFPHSWLLSLWAGLTHESQSSVPTTGTLSISRRVTSGTSNGNRQAKDAWVWYGWTVWAGERQRWFVYATFGHSAAILDSPVAPADDERDNISKVTPHAQFLGNAVYEYLPRLSRGTGEPEPTARLEFTTVDLLPGAERAFEAALSTQQSTLQTETLWYRMVAGGTVPRYLRLRPGPSLSAILEKSEEQSLPQDVSRLIVKITIEILNLRPTMCYGISPSH
jgi:hypothetical protein